MTHGTAQEADVAKVRECLDTGMQLTKETAKQLLDIPERRFRAAVSELRLQGYPVVSWSREDSAYRKARDSREANDFIDQELVPRLRVLERQARRMRERAHVHFGNGQLSLIGD